MVDEKPTCVNTCTSDECTPIVENGPLWNDLHMPCWICNSDDHTKRHDLIWHEESTVYFHKLCILTRAREQALVIADRPNATLKDCIALSMAGGLLRGHRRRIKA